MYKIIGTDQKEYGPINADQLRLWITQGRLFAQSLVRLDGSTEWKQLNTFPEFAGVAPQAAPNMPAPNDTVSTIIPYKNPQALIAYYLGIFSFIPFIGLFLGVAAFILGIRGLGFAKRNPGSKGRVHAWIGIIVGGFFGILYLIFGVLLVIGIMSRSKGF
ncbi:MAG: hypothetical protein JWQ71_1583 [Pedosphaera sp.]|nr:hypothetical protein [Pedosphaera sp.]